MSGHGHDISLAIGKMQEYVDTLARPRLPSGSRVAIRRSAIAMRAAMNEIYYEINPGAGDWKRLEVLVDTILAETKAPENVRVVRPYGDADAGSVLRA